MFKKFAEFPEAAEISVRKSGFLQITEKTCKSYAGKHNQPNRTFIHSFIQEAPFIYCKMSLQPNHTKDKNNLIKMVINLKSLNELRLSPLLTKIMSPVLNIWYFQLRK